MGGKSSQVFPRSVPVVFQNYYKYLLPLLRFQNLLSSQMGGKGSHLFRSQCRRFMFFWSNRRIHWYVTTVGLRIYSMHKFE